MLRHAFPTASARCFFVALLLSVLSLATVRAQATPTAAGGGTQLTPLLDSVLSSPRWFIGTDGRVHLVYELLLTNALTVPVSVNAVEVRNAETGATLAHLTGDPLLAAMSMATEPDVPEVVLPPATVGIVWLDVPLAGERDIPAAVEHHLTIDPPPDLPVPESWLAYTGAPVAVDQRPPVVLGAPLSGAGWAALGSCCDGPHRRALYPIDGRWYLGQRFAIDFNQLDAENRPGTGDPRQPDSFPTFGQPVLAVADATVVEAIDRYPDLLVGAAREEVTPQSAGGNRVVLDLGEGRFAVYAHLQAGSVAVAAGDQVSSGERVANVGSSGTTGGPHLHFQVLDRPSVVVGDGLPYVFDAFTLTGQTPPLADVLPYYETLEPIPITPERTGPRRDELPLGRDVVAFPAGLTTAQSPAPEAGVARPTAIVVTATNDPLRVAGSDGADHLEYDLLLTNTIAEPVTLTSLEVLTPEGETLLRLDGAALRQATQPLFSPESILEIPPSGMAAVVVDVIVPPERAVERLTHRIVYELAPEVTEKPLIGGGVVAGPELEVDPRRATVIAPPLRGAGWMAVNGCCSSQAGHRSARVAVDGKRLAKVEMFSLDFIQLQDGRLFAGDGARREDWFGYGAEVLAVADGEVVAVRDGQPEETPNVPVQHVRQPGDAGGNHVVLEIAPGVYAFYAHFQPGSLTVKTGDLVATGEPLGLLGNSGQSTAPHLHFVLIDTPDPVTANSLPMVFDRYTLAGSISSAAFDEAATGTSGGGLVPEGPPTKQTATLPLDNTVIDFP